MGRLGAYVGVQLLLKDVGRGLVAGLLAFDLLGAGILLEDDRCSTGVIASCTLPHSWAVWPCPETVVETGLRLATHNRG